MTVDREAREKILREALASLVSYPSGSPADTWERVCEAASRVDLGVRVRHHLGELRTCAEVYLSLFLPPTGFEFGGINGEGLVWSGEQSAFYDFVFAGARSTDPWALSVRPRVRRLVDAGHDRFGESFAGVRLLVPAAPARSLLVTGRKAPPGPLAASSLWFGPAMVSVEELLAGGGGS